MLAPRSDSIKVFLVTAHSFALVNLKPLTPGHVLVIPLQQHRRLTDLSRDETADLFSTVQLTQRMLAKKYFPNPEDITSASFTVALQDGPESGQTVPHVHVHIIPRLKTTDMGESADAVYTKLASEEGNVGGALWDKQQRPQPGGKMRMIEDDDRPARTKEDMNQEADDYRSLFKEMGAE